MDNENWVNINGLEGFYQVSNMGRIKSLARVNARNHFIKEKILIPILSNGYLRVNMGLYKNRKLYLIHRIVGDNFIPNLDNKPTINHKNGIKTDNRVDNLEWNTHSENHSHAYRVLGRINKTKGVNGRNHHASKKIKCDTLDIEFGSMREAERELGLYCIDISEVCRGLKKNIEGLSFRYLN